MQGFRAEPELVGHLNEPLQQYVPHLQRNLRVVGLPALFYFVEQLGVELVVQAGDVVADRQHVWLYLVRLLLLSLLY